MKKIEKQRIAELLLRLAEVEDETSIIDECKFFAEKLRGKTGISRVMELIEEAEAIINNPNLSWRLKYGTIFGMNISGYLRDLGYRIEWNDPDTTHQEDVEAYMQALIKWRNAVSNS